MLEKVEGFDFGRQRSEIVAAKSTASGVGPNGALVVGNAVQPPEKFDAHAGGRVLVFEFRLYAGEFVQLAWGEFEIRSRASQMRAPQYRICFRHVAFAHQQIDVTHVAHANGAIALLRKHQAFDWDNGDAFVLEHASQLELDPPLQEGALNRELGDLTKLARNCTGAPFFDQPGQALVEVRGHAVALRQTKDFLPVNPAGRQGARVAYDGDAQQAKEQGQFRRTMNRFFEHGRRRCGGGLRLDCADNRIPSRPRVRTGQIPRRPHEK